MAGLRFEVGAAVMCNMGSAGWMLGRIIALHYHEPHWPAEQIAPYQVMLEADHTLIYVPEDDAGYCRAATRADLRITHRLDALAALPGGVDGVDDGPTARGEALGCSGDARPGRAAYRSGRCHCCDGCPRNWSSVELYSEHYRCAERNGLTVTRRTVDLGTIRVGDTVELTDVELPSSDGFMQCPTLVRLPPGVRFGDDGSLVGAVRFDPHRDVAYRVDFVAVSTADWDDPAIGIVRLEITFVVEDNTPPVGFDVAAFQQAQQRARVQARGLLRDLFNTWDEWDHGALSIRATCDRMGADLRRLRALLEGHPRLDGGRWWGQLGGLHMNVHKLLENTLFECELYLGHALTFGDAEVRRRAEQNLDGCYQKRLLEAARFMWNDGARQMMGGEWAAAADTFRRAAAKKDGWGWAVNYGDIWLGEAAARLVLGAEQVGEGVTWLADVERLLEKCEARAEASGVFGAAGHPWAVEVRAACVAYRRLRAAGDDPTAWLGAFKARTVYWCAQILAGAGPFPPKLRPRRDPAAELIRRLPGHPA